MTPATEKTPFPITAMQRKRGNLDGEGAENIALMQDLTRTTTAATFHSQLMFDDANVMGDLSGLLALAFADDAAFTEAFPDALMRSSHNTVNDTCLPGLRQDAAGVWNQIDPDDATLAERRNYVRRHLIVNTAKKVLGFANRPMTANQIAVTAPGTLQRVYCLVNVATDVCRAFDPAFMEQFAGPSLADAMALAPSYATM